MKVNSKNSGRATSLPAALGFGTVVSIGITMLCASIMAYMLEGERMTWETAGYGIMVTLMISSYIGARISWARAKRQRFLVCILSGLVYFAVLLLVTALFFGGQYEAVWVTLALVAAGCGSAGMGEQSTGRGEKRLGTKRNVVKLYK